MVNELWSVAGRYRHIPSFEPREFQRSKELPSVTQLAIAALHQVKEKLPLSFSSAKRLYSIVEDEMPAGVPCEWFETEVALPSAPNDPQTLFYRDIAGVARFLSENPSFQGELDFEPEEVLKSDGSRVYFEMSSRSIWSNHQVCLLIWPFMEEN